MSVGRDRCGPSIRMKAIEVECVKLRDDSVRARGDLNCEIQRDGMDALRSRTRGEAPTQRKLTTRQATYNVLMNSTSSGCLSGGQEGVRVVFAMFCCSSAVVERRIEIGGRLAFIVTIIPERLAEFL